MKGIQTKGYTGFNAQKSGCIYSYNGIKLSIHLKTQYRYINVRYEQQEQLRLFFGILPIPGLKELVGSRFL